MVGRVPVGVTQGDAEVPGDRLQLRVGDVDQRGDDDEDVDGRPANDKDGDHHQDHAGDPTQVPVLLLWECEGGSREEGGLGEEE